MLRSLSSRQISFSRSLATLVKPSNPITRHNWLKEEIQEIYDTPLLDLVFRSASVHRQHHNPSKIQLCTLMNIKSQFSDLYLWKSFDDLDICFFSPLQLEDAAKIVSSKSFFS